MGSAIALVLIMFAVYIIVLFGTVAYQLTGLDWDTAQFQALSAFTNTGFTTRASESVVRHKLRRQITMGLIVLGYAATASVIATLVGSAATKSALDTVLNLSIIAVSLTVLVYAVRTRRLPLAVTDRIRHFLATRIVHDFVPHEELLEYSRGFAITRIEVPHGSRLANLTLRAADLRNYRLQVLAIDRKGEVNPVPEADWQIEVGHHMVLYGEIARVQEAFGPAPHSTSGEAPSAAPEPDAPMAAES